MKKMNNFELRSVEAGRGMPWQLKVFSALNSIHVVGTLCEKAALFSNLYTVGALTVGELPVLPLKVITGQTLCLKDSILGWTLLPFGKKLGFIVK